MSFLSSYDFYDVAEDGSITADELLDLVTQYFNGDYPIDGLTTGYLDFSQYDLSGFSSTVVTIPSNGASVSLPTVTLKTADGKSSLVLSKAEGTSTGNGNDITYDGKAALKLTLTLASGVTFSIDSATSYTNNNTTSATSHSEKYTVNFKDTKGTASTLDDIVITANNNSSGSDSLTSQKANGSNIYTYTGNGLSINSNDSWNESYTFSDTGSVLGSGTFAFSYQLTDSSTGINIGLAANSTASPVNGVVVEKVNLTDMKLANESWQISAPKATATISYDGPDINLLGSSPNAKQIAAEVMPFFFEVALASANTITLKNADGIEINGFAGNDSITGGTRADIIEGGADNDTLSGGDGNDSLSGGSGNDSLSGGTGDDQMEGDYGSIDLITSVIGSGGKDTLVGGAGNDTVFMRFAESSYAISKTDTAIVLTNRSDASSVTTIDRSIANGIEFISFNDAIPFSLNDLLAGAATIGSDTLFQRASLSNFGFAIDGLAGNDTITGTDFDDSLNGGEGKDSLFGGNGNDILDGGAGDDTLVGSGGNDLYIVDSVGDVISGEVISDGNNTIQVKGAISYALASNQRVNYLSAGEISFANNTFTFTNTNINVANIKGNEFAQYIHGNAAGNKLEGAGGNDFIFGFAGNDTLDGGEGDDTLAGCSGNDSLNGGVGDDRLDADWIDYNFPSSQQFGSSGKDTLVGGAGNDTVYMRLTEGDYSVSKTDTTIVLTNISDASSVTSIDRTAANGVELINFAESPMSIALADLLAGAASSGNDNLFQRTSLGGTGLSIDGLAGNDTITGTTFDDSLAGGDGKDSLTGLSGNDVLNGGLGDDTLDGGVGADLYIVDSALDVIKGEDVEDVNNTILGLNLSNNAVQVNGATSYVLASGQRVGYLTAGQIDVSTFGNESFNFSNISLTNTNVVNIKGNDFAQLIDGNAAANKLEGLGGDDYIHASAGNDTLDGGTGNDYLGGGRDNDSIFGGIGNDSLSGGSGNDTLDGGEGNDELGGGSGNDSLVGGAGDDKFSGDLSEFNSTTSTMDSGGKDSIVGGVGNDTVYMQFSESRYAVSKSDTAIILTNTIDSSSITTIDVTQVNGVEFVVFGSDIVPNAPISITDLLAGAASAKDDVLYLRGSGSYNGSTKVFTSSGVADSTGNGFNINGSDGNDLIFGTTNADSLVGGAGNDTLSGLGGNDSLVGGAGNDTLEIRWEQATQTDPSISTANIVMDGGAGDDTYVINGLIDKQAISLVDSAGNDTVLMKNYWWDSHYPSAYIDGTTNTLKLHARSDFESFTTPILIAQSGVIENMSLMKYSNSSTPDVAQLSVTYAVAYATKDTKGVWNAKGADKADIMFATTGGANNYDGGKGDDNISANAHADTVVQGGEGFNSLSIEDLPVEGTDLIFGQTVHSIGTLSYAWAANTVEVNMEARIGIAYDAKGEEIIGMDEFYGFANVVGGKGNDLIVGDSNGNRLDGGEGRDTLAGGGGFDTLIGGTGDDTYMVNLQDMKTIVSERIAPTVIGEVVAVNGVGGILTLQGGTDAKGLDTLVLTGFSNVMDLRFGVGDATVTVSQTGSTSIALVDKAVEQISFDTGVGTPAVYLTNWGNIGTKSADFVITKDAGGTGIGGQGDDFLMGGQGQDILLGGLGNDIIRGGAGSDKLIGNAGNDSIYVNRGDGDLALGGAGADTFVIQGASLAGLGAGTQTSRILDFKLNEDFLRFDGAVGVSITVGGITASKGVMTDPTSSLAFNLSNSGTLTSTDGLNTNVQVVSLIGIDTQQELSALMDRITIA